MAQCPQLFPKTNAENEKAGQQHCVACDGIYRLCMLGRASALTSDAAIEVKSDSTVSVCSQNGIYTLDATGTGILGRFAQNREPSKPRSNSQESA